MKTHIQVMVIASFVLTMSVNVLAQQHARSTASRQPLPIAQSNVGGPSPYLIRETAPRTMQRQSVRSYAPTPVVSPSMAPAQIVNAYPMSETINLADTECQQGCGTVPCQKCEDDTCRLELDHTPKKKTCFKTEQVSICIPPVRFPWQKCCPPGTSKTKLVNKLKVHQFECPNCDYKWKLNLPQKPQTMTPSGNSILGSFGDPKTESPEATPFSAPNETQPESKLDEGTVPKAPVVKGAFNRWNFGRKKSPKSTR